MKHILLYGPTASGKSALAIKLAERLGAVVINGDAMQCYSNLRILTARPDEDEFSDVPHYFYGKREARQIYTAADWAEDCSALLHNLDCPAIICGGSGLYFEALMSGLSILPNVSQATKERFEAEIESHGVAKLYADLQQVDSAWAEKIDSHDKQRIIRGLSVFAETGKNLSHWLSVSEKRILLNRDSYISVYLSPERDLLWQWSEERLHKMIERGVMLEVAGLFRARLHRGLPLMRAIGVGEFASFLFKENSLEHVLEKTWHATRQYIKRQDSWGRTRFRGDIVLDSPDMKKILSAL